MSFNFFKKTDSQIEQDVMKEIKWDPRVTANQVSATSKDGIVTLLGSVPHYFEKNIVAEAAQGVGGVRGIANELEVNLLGSYERSDTDIAEAAVDALEWNYQVPKGIKVTVEKGWVTLAGETDWDFERSAARNAVSLLMGVRGVSNNISIKSNVKSADVKTSIQDALKRSAENEARNISVAVKGDEVTLSGNVHSFSEMEDARFAAWMAPGVSTVKNNLILAA